MSIPDSNKPVPPSQPGTTTSQDVETLRTAARLSQSELRTLALACETPCQLRRILTLLASHSLSTAAAHSANDTGTCHAAGGCTDANASAASKSPAGTTATTGAQGVQDAQDAGQCGSITPPPTDSAFLLLATYVDETNHDLREWLKALDVFIDWLQANNRPPQPLTMLLGYLACTAMAQSGSALPLPLPHVLADMLDQYGYDGDTAISTEPEA